MVSQENHNFIRYTPFQKKNLLRVYLISGLRVYVTVCFSALVGACVWYGASETRRCIVDLVPGCRRPIPIVCSVASDFGKHNPASKQNVGPFRIPRRITILLGTPCSKKITFKRCWAAKRSGYVKSGRSRWPRACHLGLAMGTPSLSRSQKGVYISLKVCVRDTLDLPDLLFQKYLGTRYRCL